MRNDPPAATSDPDAQRAYRRDRLRRAALIGLCVATLLTLIGAGGLFAAQRYASARHVAPAPVANFITPLAPIVRPGSPDQKAPEPETIDNCACSAAHANIPTPTYGTPNVGGQVVLVSITQQWLWAYQDGRMVMASAVTTGMPQLPTPTGTYHISMKESNVWFYSPWPYGSPFYYTPEHVDYAMLFRSGGFYLHAAAWRHAFGPGTNVPHTDPDGTWETGSHGCVNLPVSAAGALYGWIGIGATVIIVH